MWGSKDSAELTLWCRLQGIDLKAGGRNKKTKRTAPKSENVYLKLLVKVLSRSNAVVTLSCDGN